MSNFSKCIEYTEKLEKRNLIYKFTVDYQFNQIIVFYSINGFNFYTSIKPKDSIKFSEQDFYNSIINEMIKSYKNYLIDKLIQFGIYGG